MRVIAICNKHIKNTFRDIDIKDFVLDGENISVAQLNVPDLDSKKYFRENSVLLKIRAFSCNYRDKALIHLLNEKCKLLSGNNNYFYSPIGSDFVADVLEVGPTVKTLKIGDRVMADCTYHLRADGSFGGVPTNYASQELQILSENQLIKVPNEMPDEVAASFTIAAQTVYSMVRKLELKKGENVLVTAATSNTSLATLSVLKNLPINIYTISSKGNSAYSLIKDVAKSATIISLSDLLENKIKVKFDAVIDPFVDIYFEKIVKFLNFNSRYISCGMYKQHLSFEEVNTENENKSLYAPLIMCSMLNASFIGNCLGTREDLERAINDFSHGRFNINIDSIYSPTDYLDFLNKTFSPDKQGKVVLKYV